MLKRVARRADMAATRSDVLLRRMLLAGQLPIRSAPTISLAAELNRVGVETEFSMGAETTNTKKWLELVRRNEALVLVRYSTATDVYLQRQLHLAGAFGCMVVRWWVGSDVLYCLRSEHAMSAARALDIAVDLNLATAPHLVEELNDIGIQAKYVPSVCDLSPLDVEPPRSLPSSVLVYLPAERKAFYGRDVVVAAIKVNTDLEFIIVGDDSHSLAHYPNVRSLGWVEDMEEVWPHVGLLLRVTRHDGLPRMVLEALARGRYVIYSWPLDGCWFAKSVEEVLRQVERFKSMPGPNAGGLEVARAIGANAGLRFMQAVALRRSMNRPARRLTSLLQAIQCQRAMTARKVS